MLKTEDLKTAYLKSDDSKYVSMCWEPQIWSVIFFGVDCLYAGVMYSCVKGALLLTDTHC